MSLETIKLFELVNGKIILTEHCHILKPLKTIMETYPKDRYMKIYYYIFYMTCPNPTLNPFFHEPDTTKENSIIKSVEINFSLDDVIIVDAVEFCKKRYETETVRAFRGMKNAYDRLSDFLMSVQYTTGRDGNITPVLAAMKNFASIKDSFKKIREDLDDEQKIVARGKTKLAYDQRKTK